MKATVLLISLVLCSLGHANAQGLIITYEETVKINLPSSQIDNPEIRAAFERQIRDLSKTAQLSINNGVSVYKVGESEQSKKRTNRVEGNQEITTSVRNINPVPHTIYKNHHDKLMLSQANFEGKEYLIEEPLINKLQWEIGRNKKEISGFQCIEATATTESGSKVTAWYTPDIPVNAGPSSYWGLPGLILYLELNDGGRVFSCTSIEQVKDMPAIQAPDKGEKMSPEQYDKMVDNRIQRLKDDANRNESSGNTTRRSAVIVTQ